VYVAYNINCRIEIEEFINVTGGHVGLHCKSDGILETMQDKHTVSMDH